MPRRPESSSFALTIDTDFDETRSYAVKLFDIEERDSQFGKAGDKFLFWKMNVYRESGEAFSDTRTEEAFELWASTSDSTFANEKTGKRSKAREYAEAFVGRELSDVEVNQMIDDGFKQALLGKTAIGSFEITSNDNGDRLNLIKLRARKAAMPAQQPVTAASRNRLDD